MTDIKQVSDWALTIAAEAAGSKLHHYERMADDNRLAQSIEAHARAIERHEAFRQEVSDEIAKLGCWPDTVNLQRFILPKPVDPLVAALVGAFGDGYEQPEADNLRAALAKRGLEVREIEG